MSSKERREVSIEMTDYITKKISVYSIYVEQKFSLLPMVFAAAIFVPKIY